MSRTANAPLSIVIVTPIHSIVLKEVDLTHSEDHTRLGSLMINQPEIQSASGCNSGHNDLVRTELQRILASTSFDASPRNRRFLAYVVEETLAGRGDRIKAYTIATDVFGRSEAFDPTLDPVIRNEARRVRNSLERFYLYDGRLSLLCITMPKGGYVPEFQSPSSASGPLGAFAGHRILISSFEMEEGENCRHSKFGMAFGQKLAARLSQFEELAVFATMSLLGNSDNPSQKLIPPDVEFRISGSVVLVRDRMDVTAMLTDARSGRIIWAATIETGVFGSNQIAELPDMIIEGMADSVMHTLKAVVAPASMS